MYEPSDRRRLMETEMAGYSSSESHYHPVHPDGGDSDLEGNRVAHYDSSTNYDSSSQFGYQSASEDVPPPINRSKSQSPPPATPAAPHLKRTASFSNNVRVYGNWSSDRPGLASTHSFEDINGNDDGDGDDDENANVPIERPKPPLKTVIWNWMREYIVFEVATIVVIVLMLLGILVVWPPWTDKGLANSQSYIRQSVPRLQNQQKSK
jgi:hypothetical protein